MATTTATRSTKTRTQGRKRHTHNEGIIPLLARAVREVEASAQRGKASPANRTKFHVIALLMREEQIPNERLRRGDYVKVYVVDVHKSTRGR